MFEKSNEQLLSSIATAVAEGKMTAEEAAKLLNTIARTEERLVDVNQQSPKHL